MDWFRRKLFLAPLALVGFMAVGLTAPVAAQNATPIAGSGGVIEVTGSGEAEGEAVGAVLQFILRAQFEEGVDPASESKFGPTNQPEVTVDQVTAVVDALVQAGVPEKKVDSALSPSGPFAGMFGYGSAVVAAEIDQDQLENIVDIAGSAVAAGDEAGVTFDPVNVAYMADDCSALDREALKDAVADGQDQAELLADVLGVSLGSLAKASKQASYGGYYGGGGAPSSSSCDLQPTLEIGLTTYLMPLDPTKPAEVEVHAQVLLTYEII